MSISQIIQERLICQKIDQCQCIIKRQQPENIIKQYSSTMRKSKLADMFMRKEDARQRKQKLQQNYDQSCIKCDLLWDQQYLSIIKIHAIFTKGQHAGEPIPLQCKWYLKTKTDFRLIQGILTPTYQPCVEDLGGIITVHIEPKIANKVYNGVTIIKEVGPIKNPACLQKMCSEFQAKPQAVFKCIVQGIFSNNNKFQFVETPLQCQMTVSLRLIRFVRISNQQEVCRYQITNKQPQVQIIRKTSNSILLNLNSTETMKVKFMDNLKRDFFSIVLNKIQKNQIQNDESFRQNYYNKNKETQSTIVSNQQQPNIDLTYTQKRKTSISLEDSLAQENADKHELLTFEQSMVNGNTYLQQLTKPVLIQIQKICQDIDKLEEVASNNIKGQIIIQQIKDNLCLLQQSEVILKNQADVLQIQTAIIKVPTRQDQQIIELQIQRTNQVPLSSQIAYVQVSQIKLQQKVVSLQQKVDSIFVNSKQSINKADQLVISHNFNTKSEEANSLQLYTKKQNHSTQEINSPLKYKKLTISKFDIIHQSIKTNQKHVEKRLQLNNHTNNNSNKLIQLKKQVQQLSRDKLKLEVSYQKQKQMNSSLTEEIKRYRSDVLLQLQYLKRENGTFKSQNQNLRKAQKQSIENIQKLNKLEKEYRFYKNQVSLLRKQVKTLTESSVRANSQIQFQNTKAAEVRIIRQSNPKDMKVIQQLREQIQRMRREQQQNEQNFKNKIDNHEAEINRLNKKMESLVHENKFLVIKREQAKHQQQKWKKLIVNNTNLNDDGKNTSKNEEMQHVQCKKKISNLQIQLKNLQMLLRYRSSEKGNQSLGLQQLVNKLTQDISERELQIESLRLVNKEITKKLNSLNGNVQ